MICFLRKDSICFREESQGKIMALTSFVIDFYPDLSKLSGEIESRIMGTAGLLRALSCSVLSNRSF